MKTIHICFFLLLLTFSVFGQKAEKGFKHLEKNDILKAQESFQKVIIEDTTNCAALFGMAIVLSNSTNASVDYFKAWDYFLLAKKYIKNLSEDENVMLKEFFTLRDTERRNRTIQYNLDVEEKIIEDKLIKYVREENNLAIAEKFIEVYPNSKFYENVVHIRNHLEYRKAEKANTFESYNKFLTKYPNAAQLDEAIRARNELAFQLAKKSNTIEAFDNFINSYPKSDHFYDAIKLRDLLAFEFAKKQNSIEAFDEFINRYPSSLHIPAAKVIQRKLLYEKAKQVNTLQAYNDFISRYPDGELFVDIFNLKTHVLGQNILSEAQGHKEMISWIKGFDSDQKNDSAGGISFVDENKIIFSGNRQRATGNGTEAWVVCLDKDGKSIWNKSFGSQNQNKVNFQTITPQGDVLLGGWDASSVDLNSAKAWLFEISGNGVGKWERNIDGRSVSSVSLSNMGGIFVSGHNSTDSIPKVLYLARLNNDYQNLWSRNYVRPGVLNSFIILSTQNIISAAGNWLWKTDASGYIQWEKFLPAGDNIVSVNSTGGIIFLAGARNNSPYLVKVNESGIYNWERNYADLTGMHFDYATVLPDKSLFTRIQGNGQLAFLHLSEKGEIIREIHFNEAEAPVCGSVVTNSLGDIYTVFTKNNISNTEIVVCKMVIK